MLKTILLSFPRAVINAGNVSLTDLDEQKSEEDSVNVVQSVDDGAMRRRHQTYHLHHDRHVDTK